MHPVSWHRHPQMSAAAKPRLDSVTLELSGKRCLIENTDESNAAEYAIVGNVDEERRLDRLEFAWNMQRFTLNVDTPLIVIRHWKRWVLLPQTSVINIYRHYNTIGKRFPAIDQKIFKYTVVASQDMVRVQIHRQKSIPTNVDEPPHDFTFNPHPIIISRSSSHMSILASSYATVAPNLLALESGLLTPGPKTS